MSTVVVALAKADPRHPNQTKSHGRPDGSILAYLYAPLLLTVWSGGATVNATFDV
jgi:hypothetical protein